MMDRNVLAAQLVVRAAECFQQAASLVKDDHRGPPAGSAQPQSVLPLQWDAAKAAPPTSPPALAAPPTEQPHHDDSRKKERQHRRQQRQHDGSRGQERQRRDQQHEGPRGQERQHRDQQHDGPRGQQEHNNLNKQRREVQVGARGRSLLSLSLARSRSPPRWPKPVTPERRSSTATGRRECSQRRDTEPRQLPPPPPPARKEEEGDDYDCRWWPIYLEEYPTERWEDLERSQKANRRRRCQKLLAQRLADRQVKSQNDQEKADAKDGDGGKHGHGQDAKDGDGGKHGHGQDAKDGDGGNDGDDADRKEDARRRRLSPASDYSGHRDADSPQW